MPLLRRAAALVLAAALSFIAAPPAFAANGVFGGATRDDDAIVLTTDAKAKKLRSAVVAWGAPCQSGQRFPMAIALKAVNDEPGFSPGPRDLVVSRNAKGRFAGTQFVALSLGEQSAAATVDLSGRLRGSRASGKLVASVTIFDAAGAQIDSCDVSLRWSATRSPGRVFGGRTSQEHPVVVRLDRKRKKATDVIVGWESTSCEPPDNFFRFPLAFSDLRIRASRFGGTFDDSVPMDDGTSLNFGYDLAGTLSRRSVRGSLKVSVAGTDAAGATTLSCGGDVTWKATTG